MPYPGRHILYSLLFSSRKKGWALFILHKTTMHSIWVFWIFMHSCHSKLWMYIPRYMYTYLWNVCIVWLDCCRGSIYYYYNYYQEFLLLFINYMYSLMYTCRVYIAGNVHVFRGQSSQRKLETPTHRFSHAKLVVGVISWNWNANNYYNSELFWGLSTLSHSAKMFTIENFPAIRYRIYSRLFSRH